MENRIRIAVLGTARISRSMVPQMHLSETAVPNVIASRSTERAREFAREFQIPIACGSYEEALRRDDVDAVYIPLPPSLHCEWTIRAAEAGKHVLCEKPLSVSAAEARMMIDACKAHGVVLLDGTMWYHTSRARVMKQMVDDGTVGETRQVTSAFTFPGDVLAADNLRFARELGGGSLLDIGWYCVGVSLWMMNELPFRVFATAEYRNEIDVHLNGLLWFSNGRMASLESGFTAIRRRWVEIAGTKSALVCDDFSRPWNPEKPRFWVHDAHGVSHQHVCEHPPVERCLVDAFGSLIRDRDVSHSWLMLSERTQRVCDALATSARNGSAMLMTDVSQ